MADRATFDAYARDLSSLSDAAALRVRQLLARLDGLPEADALRLLSRYYPALVRRYGADAAERARAYYQAERDAADPGQGYAATSAGGGEASWYGEDVEEARQGGRGGHALAGLGDLPGRAAQRVMARADRTIDLNLRRDPARPHWAVVAAPGACGFCVMVSSNGWNYRSKAAAQAQRHENCRCAVAVSFGGDPRLDGYDPDAMRDAYSACEEAVRDDVERQWARMSPEERAGYGRKGRSAKDVYRTRRVAEEMNRRDRDWLQTGRAPSYDVLAGARPSAKERGLAEALAPDGWKAEFRPTRSAQGKRTSDAFLVSGHDDVGDGSGYARTPVEFKQPTGNGSQTVFHQFEEAAGQAHWLVLDARGLGDRWDEASVEAEVTRKLGRSFRAGGDGDEAGWRFERCTVVEKDGSVRHYLVPRHG